MNRNSTTFRFLRDIPLQANAIATVTLILWLAKATLFDPGLAADTIAFGVTKVIDGLFSAILAGYIFYVLFALLPDFQSRETLNEYIVKKVGMLCGDCSGIMKEIENQGTQGLTFWDTNRSMVEKVFTHTQMSTKPNMLMGNGQPANWIDFFLWRMDRSEATIRALFDQARFLEPNLIRELTSLQDNAFFGMIRMARGSSMPITNTNLQAWGPSFFKYLEICRALAKWHETNRPTEVPKLGF